MAKGKFTEWLTPDGLLLIECWAREGLTDEQISKNIGVAYSTLREWVAKFPAISAALKKGKAPVDFEVENALLKRALGYEWEEVTTEVYGDGRKHVRKVTRNVPPDVGAIAFWLKNRKPKKWRDRPADDATTDVLRKAVEVLEGIDGVIK